MKLKLLAAISATFVFAGVPSAVAASVRQAAPPCPSHGARFEPADGKILNIIGQDRDAMDAYVAGTGSVAGGFMTYTSIAAPVAGLHAPINFGGWSHGQHIVDTYPQSAVQVGIGVVPMEATNEGLNDPNILVLGDWIKRSRRPVFLRIGYEFDGDHNAYEPGPYVKSFRRIVDKLREQNVTNVAFVWHSGSKGTWKGYPMADWYPGDDYVDWTGVSIFNTGQIAFANEMADFADAHSKPIMIAESTPIGHSAPTADVNAMWTAWHAPVIDFSTTRKVKAWSYINQNWEAAGWPGWGDSRVESNPDLETRWLAEIGQPKYLTASPTLFCEGLGYEAAEPDPLLPVPVVPEAGAAVTLLPLSALAAGLMAHVLRRRRRTA